MIDQRASPNAGDNFGPFAEICRAGGYLSLLGMRSFEVVAILQSIAGIVRADTDYPRFVSRLLDDRNWRGHLIGLTTILLSDDPAAHSSMLWRAFDRGSWMAPQLAVALYCSDPRFTTEARRRIAARCPIVDDDGFFFGETRGASAKNLASLLRTLAYVPSEASWAEVELRARDVHELLRADDDSAAAIVEWWFDAARARFGEFGHSLGAAA